MDNPDSRVKLSPEDGQPLGLAETISFEDSHYVTLKQDLDSDAQNLESESWSLTADQNLLKSLSKEAVKRQDVIYELMYTELNLVRTLKILSHVYMFELKRTLQMDEVKLDRLFPALQHLLSLHQHFLSALKGLQEGPPPYSAAQLGSVLTSQFSGVMGTQLVQSYSQFCSLQPEALSFYKEQMQVNRKLQILVKRIDQLPLVQRLGIPDRFLLVAQRITMYPVLVERILQNTEAKTEEHRSLERALVLIRDTIAQVDMNVCEYKKVLRLRDIGHRLEGRPLSRPKEPCVFRREDLIQGGCTLLHEGTLTWKWSGKQKEVLAVLLSDMLLLLQEKEQKLVFASMEARVQVIPLQRLIVREVAMEEKAMYLIYMSTGALPEMYELHCSSKDDCLQWMALIRRAVDSQQEEELYKEKVRMLQQFQDFLQSMDEQIQECLSKKLKASARLYENLAGQRPPHTSLLLRSDSKEAPQGAELLHNAIDEVENLQNLLLMRLMYPHLPAGAGLPQSSTQLLGADAVDQAEPPKDRPLIPAEEPPPADGPEVLENSATPAAPDPFVKLLRLLQTEVDAPPQHRSSSNSSIASETAVCDVVIKLMETLYSLKAVVAQQDSRIELHQAVQLKHPRHHSNLLLEQERQRNAEKQKEDLAQLQRLQAQQREEQQRWEKERERHARRVEVLEAQLQQREEECKRREEKLSEEKGELERQKEEYQEDLERLRNTTQTLDREKRLLRQEKERLEKLRQKLLRGNHHYEDPAAGRNPAPGPQPSSHPSLNGGGTVTRNAKSPTPQPEDTPPKVPQRSVSMRSRSSKHPLSKAAASTAAPAQTATAVQQKIPTKLASKGKEKSLKGRKTHHRTQSAAVIEFNEVLPIRTTGKEGGSLRAERSGSPQRILNPDFFTPPQNRKLLDAPPPVPPPFPKEILDKEGEEKLQTAL